MPARRFPITSRHRSADNAKNNFAATPLNLALQAIETERGNLSRAESLIGCLAIAMEYGTLGQEVPYYPEVAQLARELVRKSISALDPINLPRPSQDKVREEFSANVGGLLLCALGEVPLQPRIFAKSPRQWALRIHRRNYARTTARWASSRDSASANMSG